MSSNLKADEMGCLAISRKEGERVRIGEHVEIIITEIREKRVGIRILAPKYMTILRDDAKERE